ncbi:hypothetical protein CRI94_03310 [Longibacter salinarum]|uniref:Glycosyl transferase family 8 n=1 Tax=Longibacter salinarum TaxID=1850348 RepID=A0A2A8D357_9BACT|nr:hypothetical protein [Longibacter salinarum]PEN15320.1 hypothetical protein CRI94_03310 [Longibacter salinarum]
MRVRISIVGEPESAFINMMKLLVYSIRSRAGALSDAPITLSVNGRDMPATDRQQLESMGDVNVRVMPRHYGWLFANKFNALFPADTSYDVLLYLDADTCSFADLGPMVDGLDPGRAQFRGRMMGEIGSQEAGPLDALIREFAVPDGASAADVQDARFPRDIPLFNCGVMVMTKPAVEIVRYHAPRIAYELVSRRASSAVESLPGLFRETAHRLYARFFPSRQKTTYAYWVAEQLAVAFALLSNEVEYDLLDHTYNWELATSPDDAEAPAIFHYLKGRHELDRAALFDGPWLDAYARSDSGPRRALANLARECASHLIQSTQTAPPAS